MITVEDHNGIVAATCTPAYQKGLPVIWGTSGETVTPARIVNLPSDVLKVTVVQKRKSEARARLKFKDRIEVWVLGYNSDKDVVLLIKVRSCA